MIYVDSIQRGATPWRGGAFSHLISDESIAELLAFATALGLKSTWFQHNSPDSLPHLDVTPGFRTRAIAAGAIPVDKYGFVAAVKRYRERNPGPWTPPNSR